MRRSDFEATLATRAALVRRHLSVFVRANDVTGARIGVIVGRKIAPRAVDRNRIKRMAREVFRHQQSLLGSNDLVILVRRCPARDAWSALRGELGWLVGEIARQEGRRGG